MIFVHKILLKTNIVSPDLGTSGPLNERGFKPRLNEKGENKSMSPRKLHLTPSI